MICWQQACPAESHTFDGTCRRDSLIHYGLLVLRFLHGQEPELDLHFSQWIDGEQ
ncbi:hypothetical protein D3C81_2147090 [compost metagenome]